ncbi:MAG: GNAT family N-acetyltransferase [Oscillospiraceae bacterium]|nr:GNAT family N-acetyltransferase [Oscillospiraceae bacterium]
MSYDIFQLYNKCFPGFQMNREVWNNCLKPEIACIIRVYEGKETIGFSMIHGNSITLLCVDEKHRGKGYGSGLLKVSEEHIKSSGAAHIILGQGRYYVLQGVPAENPDITSFFMKRGYEAEWTSVNMSIQLDIFDSDALNLPPLPESVSFRFAEEADKEELLAAVEDADSKWVRFFEDCKDPVMLAVSDGEITGFQILITEDAQFSGEKEKFAYIGCVGVINKARGLGIGRRMVAEGMNFLKQEGCTAAELRYVAIADWYSKLGFHVVSEQWMGEKKL